MHITEPGVAKQLAVLHVLKLLCMGLRFFFLTSFLPFCLLLVSFLRSLLMLDIAPKIKLIVVVLVERLRGKDQLITALVFQAIVNTRCDQEQTAKL